MKRVLLILLAVLSLHPAQGQLNQALIAAAHRRNITPPSGPVLVAATNSGSITGGDINPTPAVDTTGANLIVIQYSSALGVTAPTDSKGNTWTPLNTYTNSVYNGLLYYCFNPTVGSGHTFNPNTTGTEYPSICVAAFSGLSTSPFDTQNGAGGAEVTTLQPGSITASQANVLVITGVSISGGASSDANIDSGFTIATYLGASGGTSGAAVGSAIAYKVLSSVAAQNPTWTQATAGGFRTAEIAAFKY